MIPAAGARRPLGIPALALAALLVAAALPRLWRFEAVGEGTDEAYSVMATRAMLEGRFSYEDLNDFTADGYQAKFTPVAEAVAVPFVALLGDRPLAFRLPALLATLGTLALLAVHLGRRHGRWAVWALAGLAVLDYRSVYYAQTHRYVALEQLLLVGAFLAAVKAERTRRASWAVLFGVLSLLAFHSHFFAHLVVVPICVALAWESWRTRKGPRRFPRGAFVVGSLLAAEAVVVLLIFRRHASHGLFESASLGESLRRTAGSTTRMLGGLGIPGTVLCVVALLSLRRRVAFADRAVHVVVLGGVLLFLLAGLRYGIRPRYGLALQPFLWIAVSAWVARAGPPWIPSPGWRTTSVVFLAVVGSLATALYLKDGGGRDAEEDAIAVLRAAAKPGDDVLYDTGYQDPWRRRPTDLPAFSKERARAAGGVRALDEAGVRFVVRSSEEPRGLLDRREFLRRLEPVGEPVVVQRPFQDPLRVTVHRILPP